jgi:hypothetical protein
MAEDSSWETFTKRRATWSERSLGRYDYEGGAYVRIAAYGDIGTALALDMVEILVKLKREELAQRANNSGT